MLKNSVYKYVYIYISLGGIFTTSDFIVEILKSMKNDVFWGM